MYKYNGSVLWKQIIFVLFDNFLPKGFLNNDIVWSACLTRLAISFLTCQMFESSDSSNVIHFLLPLS